MNYKVRIGHLEFSDGQRSIVNDIMSSGMVTEGKYTKLLEDFWGEYVGVSDVIACNSGTSGLILALEGLKYVYNMNTGRVVVPALTFPATLNSVLLTGYSGVLCDVGDDMLLNVDNDFIEEESVDGIIPVHLMGYPCDMDKIRNLALKYDLFVLEDCCEAAGSSYKGFKVGSFGDVGVFSFYVSHPAGIGELGLITTNDQDLASLIRSLKNHGRVGSHDGFFHDYVGGNFKTTEFMSGLAFDKVHSLDDIVSERYENVKYLNSVIFNDGLSLPELVEGVSYLGYPVIAKSEGVKERVIENLHSGGVETRDMFPCLTNQKSFGGFFDTSFCPNSLFFDKLGFYLPVHEYLSNEDLDLIGYLASR